jgi:glycyl-tRNA synthetase beta chain
MPEFFLELFSEEIPARMQREAGIQLEKICAAALAPLKINVVEIFTGPRRIALKAILNAQTEARQIEERGPRDTAPEAALAGFLGKHKAGREDVVTEGGYFLLRRTEPAMPAKTLITATLAPALAKFSWPKSMRWGQSGPFTWVRPLRSMICLLTGETIEFSVGPVTSGNQTEGHRFLSPGVFPVSSAAEWQDKLRNHHVIADQNERREILVAGLKRQADKHQLSLVEDDGLIDEVTGLVEWPVALIGTIDQAFMDLPPEVRELSMKVNQRYFALRDSAGKPAPYFAFVSNIEAKDGGKAIISGNERVLRARLSDARHFWDQDLKNSLSDLLPKLDKITFHAKIGTQGERVKRIAALSYEIAKLLGANEDIAKQAEWAGMLSKADLVTGMVGEFPELQGIMGGYYAERNPRGWNGALVGPAIATHYQPKGPSDSVPTGTVAISVALADKLDTLIEFFRIDEKPTGSGDPYALRRAALGIIRIILENRLSDFELADLNLEFPELFTFILERLRVKLKNEGKRFDILDAAIAFVAAGNLFSLMEKVEAISALVGSEDGVNLLVAYRRAVNILKIEDAKDGPHQANDFVPEFAVTEDNILHSALQIVGSKVWHHAAEGNYLQAMNALATLRGPIDVFFEKVTVNAPEPELRRNRLALLAQLRKTMHLVADFSKIEG